ncbi:hypothetical protein [Pedobacter sp.]|uniref:hypothetical protein n=1 Tax=Pedobacter sp. TaxID=1411316 RepID=UPI0031D4A538
MENSTNHTKKILTPSVVHDDLPEVKKPEHLRKVPADQDSALPENPERNYHHDELRSENTGRKEIRQADDDIWNGEDA